MKVLEHQIYRFGEFRLDVGKRRLTRGDEVIPVTSRVFETLLYLVRNAGSVVDKDELMSAVWGDTVVEENNLNKNISKLRRILGEKLGENNYIATVAGRGYQFVAEVREIDATFESQPDIPAEMQDIPSTTGDQTDPYAKKPSRFWLITLAILCVFGLTSFAFYVWRENPGFSEDRAIRSVAVLPFKSLLAEQRNEALELGMADAMIAKLSGVERLEVRPLSSVRKYASGETDSPLAGRELNAEAVLDGTIQTSGDRIRISARLLRSSDGKQLWTGQFDEMFTDIFAVQDSISERVASALQSRLSRRRSHTDNIEAYQSYLNGRFHTFKLTPTEVQKGILYFNRAIELDPNYALAYVGLADAYRTVGLIGGMPDALSKAKEAASKAIEIDEQLAEGHAILGFIIFFHDWDWAAAEKELTYALRLDPNSADAHFAYAHLLSNTGRHTEALAEARRASELDPLNMRTVGLESLFLLHAGKTDEAIARRERALELDPHFWGKYQGSAMFFIDKGMYGEAAEAARKAIELSGRNPWAMALAGHALAKSGKPDEARAIADDLLKDSGGPNFRPHSVALVYAALGEKDKAFYWLERGFELRDPGMTFLKVDRKWNDLRSDPRFVELLKKMNLE
jgi:DNA-binding winged helix-turn-helix (wHTH) protein/TolB-like protein/tetratricopeptide (TPR) repeat protein